MGWRRWGTLDGNPGGKSALKWFGRAILMGCLAWREPLVVAADEVVYACEDPEPLRMFGARDGGVARRRANEKGLVAVFAGLNRDKVNLFRDVQRYSFWAVPAELAERLVYGLEVQPQNYAEMDFLEWLVRRGKAEKRAAGRTATYRLKDEEVAKDMFRQLLRIKAYGAEEVWAISQTWRAKRGGLTAEG
jgi:hypothetical protein